MLRCQTFHRFKLFPKFQFHALLQLRDLRGQNRKRGRLIPRDVYVSLHLYTYHIYMSYSILSATFHSSFPFVVLLCSRGFCSSGRVTRKFQKANGWKVKITPPEQSTRNPSVVFLGGSMCVLFFLGGV